MDEYKLGMKETGYIVAGFALMNIFARALGGIFADIVGKKYGTYGKVVLLALFLACEGIGILFFAKAESLSLSIVFLITLALFIKMSNGVTYAIVPFVNKQALGSVSGIVGAGGNVGAIFATITLISFGFRDAFSWIGMGVCATAAITLLMRFKKPVLYVEKGIDDSTDVKISKVA
jgi:MFS transporter, NNP family, nitrate/nitrite transporter